MMLRGRTLDAAPAMPWPYLLAVLVTLTVLLLIAAAASNRKP